MTSRDDNQGRQQRRTASQKARPTTERALSLLETLASLGRPGTLKELASLQEMPPATAFRLLKRLEDEAFVIRDAGSRRYAVGPRLTRLGIDIVRSSGPNSARTAILTDVVSAIGETCNLTTLVGTDVLYLDRVETRWPLRLSLEPGSRVPAHCTASGKLFLATMPEETRERILGTLDLTQHTPKTIIDHKVLRRDLGRSARRGYATDDEEFLQGLAAIAVPIQDRRGRTFAALACHAPVARIDLKGLIGEVPRLVEAAVRLAKTFE